MCGYPNPPEMGVNASQFLLLLLIFYWGGTHWALKNHYFAWSALCVTWICSMQGLSMEKDSFASGLHGVLLFCLTKVQLSRSWMERSKEEVELSLQVSWWEYSGLGGLQALALGHNGPQPSSALKCGPLGACLGACMPDVLSGGEGDRLPSEMHQNPCFYRAFLFW